MNLKRIVCPVDLSPPDKSSLAQGLSLARWHDAELHVVHVRPSGQNDVAGDVRGGERERISRFVEALKPDGANVVLAPLEGEPVAAIAEYARRMLADLVIVAQRGGRGSYWSSATFAAAVGAAVPCPTIAVPQGNEAPADAEPLFRNVLCAVDFSQVSLAALDKALALAQESAGLLTLLHVLEGFPYETVYSGSRAFRVMHEYRARVRRVNRELHSLVPRDALNWCEAEAETVSGAPHEAILATAAKRRSDLIVMGLPRRRRLERLLAGSTAKKVLRRATSPVLLVPGSSPASATVFKRMDERTGEFEQPRESTWHGAFAMRSDRAQMRI